MIAPEDVRRLALALPEAAEAPHFESTSFRVRGKIFCTMDPEGLRVVLKLDPEDQHNLAEGYGDAVAAIDGYWGRNGWTRVDCRELDEVTVANVLKMAWANVAPKRLIAAFSRSGSMGG